MVSPTFPFARTVHRVPRHFGQLRHIFGTHLSASGVQSHRQSPFHLFPPFAWPADVGGCGRFQEMTPPV